MVHRVLVVFKGLRDHLAKLESGAVPELMVPVGCLESQAPRVTVALMDSPDCLVKRDTGGSPDLKDLQEPPEKMGREAKMERSGLGD